MLPNNKLFPIVLLIALAFFVLVMDSPTPAQSTPVVIATPKPMPIAQPTSTPTPTSNIALDYTEVSRANQGDNTRLVLAVKATINSGEVTINFQNFILNIAVERGGPPPIQAGDFIYTGTAKPVETGNVTIDSYGGESFQLTFEFATLQNNAHGKTPFTNYELVYSGSITAASPSPSPSVPEFPAIAIVPLFIVPLIVAINLKRKRSTDRCPLSVHADTLEKCWKRATTRVAADLLPQVKKVRKNYQLTFLLYLFK